MSHFCDFSRNGTMAAKTALPETDYHPIPLSKAKQAANDYWPCVDSYCNETSNSPPYKYFTNHKAIL